MNLLVAVGDIHGYLDKFLDLMEKLSYRVDFEHTPFVFLGDYVDGGPDSRKVVKLLRVYDDLFPNWTFLMGNHEHMMLDALLGNSAWYGTPYQWYHQGGKQTATSYLAQPIGPYDFDIARSILCREAMDDLTWMASLPTLHETTSFYFVHAGLQPNMNAEDTNDLDRLWLRTEFIEAQGNWDKKVVFGHTPRLEGPWIMADKIGIDTMHHGHGCITAAILDDDTGELVEFVQSRT